jgi:hypothetical protein
MGRVDVTDGAHASATTSGGRYFMGEAGPFWANSGLADEMRARAKKPVAVRRYAVIVSPPGSVADADRLLAP